MSAAMFLSTSVYKWMRCFFTCPESITSYVQCTLTAADVFENVHELLNTAYIFNPSPSTSAGKIVNCHRVLWPIHSSILFHSQLFCRDRLDMLSPFFPYIFSLHLSWPLLPQYHLKCSLVCDQRRKH